MKFLKPAFAALAMACLIISPLAIATPFLITQTSFTPGSGYGSSSSRLDVDFTASPVLPGLTNLNAVNDFFTFNFGTVKLNEEDVGNGETNDLGVMANFTFVNPLGAQQTINAAGTATSS